MCRTLITHIMCHREMHAEMHKSRAPQLGGADTAAHLQRLCLMLPNCSSIDTYMVPKAHCCKSESRHVQPRPEMIDAKTDGPEASEKRDQACTFNVWQHVATAWPKRLVGRCTHSRRFAWRVLWAHNQFSDGACNTSRLTSIQAA